MPKEDVNRRRVFRRLQTRARHVFTIHLLDQRQSKVGAKGVNPCDT